MDPIIITGIILTAGAVFVVPLVWLLVHVTALLADLMCVAREFIGVFIGGTRRK